jgi:hypothetical protein
MNRKTYIIVDAQNPEMTHHQIFILSDWWTARYVSGHYIGYVVLPKATRFTGRPIQGKRVNDVEYETVEAAFEGGFEYFI